MILHILLEQGCITLPLIQENRYPNPNNTRKSHCQYHRIIRHSTNHCRVLIRLIKNFGYHRDNPLRLA